MEGEAVGRFPPFDGDRDGVGRVRGFDFRFGNSGTQGKQNRGENRIHRGYGCGEPSEQFRLHLVRRHVEILRGDKPRFIAENFYSAPVRLLLRRRGFGQSLIYEFQFPNIISPEHIGFAVGADRSKKETADCGVRFASENFKRVFTCGEIELNICTAERDGQRRFSVGQTEE